MRGVRVERLARDLGVTKGSFYWHFKNRDALFDQMLVHWTHTWTTTVIEEIKALALDTRQRLRHLLEQVTRQRIGRYDLAVRAWAIFDERAALAVERVDRIRYAYVEGLLRELGFGGLDLRVRARALLYCQVAEPTIRLGDSREERVAMLSHQVEVITTR